MRVVVADDAVILREGLARLLTEAGLEIAGLAGDADELVSLVERERPDVAIVDIRMPPTHTDEGLRAAKEIRARAPATGILVLSQHVRASYALELLSEGSEGVGYLLKERVSDVTELVRALNDVARGGSALDPKIVEGLMLRRPDEASSPLRGLTEKERAVLEQMASGRTNASISRTLYMSERSVEKHISAVFLKLGLDDEGESNRRVMAVLAFVDATR